jgi:hypothetical protein
MITSMVLYSAYKHYKKWKASGDENEGGEDDVESNDISHVSDGNGNGNRNVNGKSVGIFDNLDIKKHIKTVGICVVYMIIGPALILLNKYILSDLDFPYPMFLSGLGVGVSALVARILVSLGYVQLTKKDAVDGILWYKRVLPVGLAHAGTLAFGNTVYLLLNVGFIQMLKSFTPVIILITSVIAKIENPNIPTWLSIFMISIGTAATCSYTANLSVLGLCIMFMAEFAEAIRLLMTQHLLQNLKFSIIEGQYVLAPATAFWLFMASAMYEGSSMYEANAFTIIKNNFWIFLLASLMGLCVNFMSYLVIQVTSSLTMKVLGSARNVFTIALGVMLWGDVISGSAVGGYFITMMGFVAYNIAKSGKWERIQFPPTILRNVPCGVMLQDMFDNWDEARSQRDRDQSSDSISTNSSSGIGSNTMSMTASSSSSSLSSSSLSISSPSKEKDSRVNLPTILADEDIRNHGVGVSVGIAMGNMGGSSGGSTKTASTRSRKSSYSTGSNVYSVGRANVQQNEKKNLISDHDDELQEP